MNLAEALRKMVEPLAAQAETGRMHWIARHECDEEETFCYECGEKRRQELLCICIFLRLLGHPIDPNAWDNLEELDGGWGAFESDGCRHCETCGKILDYCLTAWGVGAEIDHFEENGFSLNPDECFHILRIIEDRTDDEQVEIMCRMFAVMGMIKLWRIFGSPGVKKR